MKSQWSFVLLLFVFLSVLVSADPSSQLTFVEGYNGLIKVNSDVIMYAFYHYLDASNASQNSHKIILVLNNTPFILNQDAFTILQEGPDEPYILRMASRAPMSFIEPTEVSLEFHQDGTINIGKTIH